MNEISGELGKLGSWPAVLSSVTGGTTMEAGGRMEAVKLGAPALHNRGVQDSLHNLPAPLLPWETLLP